MMRLELLEYVNDNLPNGFLPYYIYNIIVDEVEVGRIVLREGRDEDVYYEGHIGYSIYEEHRGHNFAYQACLLIKGLVNREYLLITCDPCNQASLSVIKKLGCEYMETKSIPPHLKKQFSKDEKEKMIYKWKITS